MFVDGRTETAGILEFAGELAQEHGAHLTGVFIQPEPAVTQAEMFARGKGIRNVIEEHRVQLEGIEADHRARFEDIVRRHGIRSEWRSLPYFSSDVAVHAHYADLTVVARPDPAGQTAGPPGFVESLVLTSGRPIICSRHGARHPGSAGSWWAGTPRARPSGPWRTPCHCS